MNYSTPVLFKRIKQVLIALTGLLISFVATSQETEAFKLIVADSTWFKERFEFPLNFAREIDNQGYEEAVFPKGWGKEESNSFWSYAFAWNINGHKEFFENDLSIDLQMYFNGLMGIDSTTVELHRNKDLSSASIFKGRIETFDGLRTKKPLNLNVLVEIHFCKVENKTIIFFRFSPKDFENEVWLMLNQLTLQETLCNI